MAAVQQTSFGCDGLIFGGYYADPETQCQQYSVCLQVSVWRIFPHTYNTFLNAKNERKHSQPNAMIIRIRIGKMYLYRTPLTHLPFTPYPSYAPMEPFSTNSSLIVIGGKSACLSSKLNNKIKVFHKARLLKLMNTKIMI